MPPVGRERALEEHRLDAMMVVEVLDMAQIGHGGGDGGMEVGSAVPRDLQVMGLRHGGRAQPDGVAAAPGDVGLQAVDRRRPRACGRSSQGCSRTPPPPRHRRSSARTWWSPAKLSEDTGSSNQVTPNCSAMVRPRRMACLAV